MKYKLHNLGDHELHNLEGCSLKKILTLILTVLFLLLLHQFETTFVNSGEIEEPFSLTLPKDYPYEGKVMMLQKINSQNGGYLFEDAGYIRIGVFLL